jgi:hypothetical protein
MPQIHYIDPCVDLGPMKQCTLQNSNSKTNRLLTVAAAGTFFQPNKFISISSLPSAPNLLLQLMFTASFASAGASRRGRGGSVPRVRKIITSACLASLRLDLSVRGGALRGVSALVDSTAQSNIVDGKRVRKACEFFLTSNEGEQHHRKPRTGASPFILSATRYRCLF